MYFWVYTYLVQCFGTKPTNAHNVSARPRTLVYFAPWARMTDLINLNNKKHDAKHANNFIYCLKTPSKNRLCGSDSFPDHKRTYKKKMK